MPKGKEIRTDARKLAGAVTDAAKKADDFSNRMSSVAKAVEKVGKTANDAAKKA